MSIIKMSPYLSICEFMYGIPVGRENHTTTVGFWPCLPGTNWAPSVKGQTAIQIASPWTVYILFHMHKQMLGYDLTIFSPPALPTLEYTWWRHQMETFSALLALWAGNWLVNGEFPSQRPVTRGFDNFFDLHLNKRLNEQSWGWWFETPSRPLWHHCKDIFSCWHCHVVYRLSNWILTI